jgi:hypothetical protein
MPVQTLLTTVFTLSLEQFLHWRYGPAGLVGLLLLTVGVRTGNPTCSSLGAVVLALLITGPAL